MAVYWNVNEENDLGIIISEDMKWDKQCGAAVSKAILNVPVVFLLVQGR